MPRDTRKIIRGVRVEGRTITDTDELEKVMTPQQCDYLKGRGAITGDGWNPQGRSQPQMMQTAPSGNSVERDLISHTEELRRENEELKRQIKGAAPGVNEDAVTELEWLRKENEQLKAQMKDFYQGNASQVPQGGKDVNAGSVKDQVKSDGKDANANKSEQAQATPQAAVANAPKTDAGHQQHQQHQGGGKKK